MKSHVTHTLVLVLVLVATMAKASPLRDISHDPSIVPGGGIDPTVTFDTLDGGNEYYKVRMLTRGPIGQAVVETGPLHPVSTTVLPPTPGPRAAEVLHGIGNNFVVIRSYASGRDLLVGAMLGAAPGGSALPCIETWGLAESEILPVEEDGEVVGVLFRQEIHDGLDDLAIEREVRAVGDSFTSASAALVLRVRNSGSEEARLGVRFTLSPDMAMIRQPGDLLLPGTSSHYLGLLPPVPWSEPLRALEGRWGEPPWRAWIVHARAEPSLDPWLYFNGGSVQGTSTANPPSTTPELVQYALWRSLDERGIAETCFHAGIEDPPRAIGSSSNALAMFWGPTEDEALHLAPGEEIELVTHVFSFLEWPVSCDAGAARAVECGGASTDVRLDGTGSHVSDGTPPAFTWSSPEEGVTFSDPGSADPLAGLPGIGEWPLELLVEVGPYFDECATRVEVVDTTPPVIDAPAVVVARTSELGEPRCAAPVILVAAATDLCAGTDVVVTNDATSGGADASGEYPLGETVVTFTAVDPSGNIEEQATTVRVIDDTPPRFESLSADPAVLWPPNHRFVDVAVEAAVTDDCDASPEVRLVAVRSSQPPDARGDGRTESDVAGADLGTADFTVQLRAERDGRAGRRTTARDRHYVLTYEAEDDSGNTARAEVSVVVPHDRGRRSRSRP